MLPAAHMKAATVQQKTKSKLVPVAVASGVVVVAAGYLVCRHRMKQNRIQAEVDQIIKQGMANIQKRANVQNLTLYTAQARKLLEEFVPVMRKHAEARKFQEAMEMLCLAFLADNVDVASMPSHIGGQDALANLSQEDQNTLEAFLKELKALIEKYPAAAELFNNLLLSDEDKIIASNLIKSCLLPSLPPSLPPD